MVTLRELKVILDQIPSDLMDLPIYSTCNLAVKKNNEWAAYIDLVGGRLVESREGMNGK